MLKRTLKNIIKISNNRNCDIVIVLDAQEWEVCPCDIECLGLDAMCIYEYSRNIKNNKYNEYILIDLIRIEGKWITIEEAFKNKKALKEE